MTVQETSREDSPRMLCSSGWKFTGAVRDAQFAADTRQFSQVYGIQLEHAAQNSPKASKTQLMWYMLKIEKKKTSYYTPMHTLN